MLEVSLRASQQRSSGRKIFPKEEKEQKREEQISYHPKSQRKEKKKNNRSKMSSSLHTAMEDVRIKGTIRRYFYHRNE